MSDAMKALLRRARAAAKNVDAEHAHAELDQALYEYVAAVDPAGSKRLGAIVKDMTLWYA